jgi:hypothetical protein
MRTVILVFFLACSMVSTGQINPRCFVKKFFLLIQSTKDYPAALLTAQQAAKEFAIKLDLRRLVRDKRSHLGLSLPADTCLKYSEEEGGDGDSSCYMARGRWDDGIYISIECSDAYSGFSKGYYIVVVGSGDQKDAALVAVFEKVRSKYADAYIKATRVYMCCMH